MNCKLGPKKHRKCEAASGRKYGMCLVRGNTEHYWAYCLSPVGVEPFYADYVNYKTGEVDLNGGMLVPPVAPLEPLPACTTLHDVNGD